MTKKLDAAIIDLVDEELEDELLHAECYTDCFFRAKALLTHYIDCRKRRMLQEMKGTNRRLRELIAKLEDHSMSSEASFAGVIPADTTGALQYQTTQREPHKENGESMSSTVGYGEAQTVLPN